MYYLAEGAVVPPAYRRTAHLRRECWQLQRSEQVAEVAAPPAGVPLCETCLRYQAATDALSLWRNLGRPVALAALAVLALASAAAGATSTSIDVEWEAPTTNVDSTPLMDLAGYRLYVAAPCPSQQYASITSPTAAPGPGELVRTTVQGLTPATTYAVRVTAVDFSGNESPCSAAVTGATPAATPPVARAASTFDDPPEMPLSEGGTWGDSAGLLRLRKSNGVVHAVPQINAAARWIGPPLADDQASTVVLSAGLVNQFAAGTSCRATSAGLGYEIRASGGGGWIVFKNGVFLSEGHAASVIGDAITARCVGARFEALIRGAVVFSLDDPNPITSGQPAIFINGDSGRAFTSWTGESVGGGPPAPATGVSVIFTP